MNPLHPEKLGFKLGFRVAVISDPNVEFEDDDARTRQEVVYVAVCSDGTYVKIGRTASGLKARWYPVFLMLRAVPKKSLRPNELEDRRRWLNIVSGKKFEIWFKRASTCEVSLCSIFGSRTFSLAAAEEQYLDAYYEPKIGNSLTLRRKTKSSLVQLPAQIVDG